MVLAFVPRGSPRLDIFVVSTSSRLVLRAAAGAAGGGAKPKACKGRAGEVRGYLPAGKPIRRAARLRAETGAAEGGAKPLKGGVPGTGGEAPGAAKGGALSPRPTRPG